MVFTGNDFIQYSDPYSKVKTRFEDGGKVFVYAYNESALVLKTPYFILPDGSQYAATALAASYAGYIGVAEAAVDAGSYGWVQIRGFCSDVQGAATKLKGSYGHSVYFSAAGVAASASAFMGLSEQWAVICEDIGGGASTTVNLWILGNEGATPLA